MLQQSIKIIKRTDLQVFLYRYGYQFFITFRFINQKISCVIVHQLKSTILKDKRVQDRINIEDV